MTEKEKLRREWEKLRMYNFILGLAERNKDKKIAPAHKKYFEGEISKKECAKIINEANTEYSVYILDCHKDQKGFRKYYNKYEGKPAYREEGILFSKELHL